MRKPKLVRYNDPRHYLMYQLHKPVDEVLGTGVDTLSAGLVLG